MSFCADLLYFLMTSWRNFNSFISVFLKFDSDDEFQRRQAVNNVNASYAVFRLLMPRDRGLDVSEPLACHWKADCQPWAMWRRSPNSDFCAARRITATKQKLGGLLLHGGSWHSIHIFCVTSDQKTSGGCSAPWHQHISEWRDTGSPQLYQVADKLPQRGGKSDPGPP